MVIDNYSEKSHMSLIQLRDTELEDWMKFEELFVLNKMGRILEFSSVLYLQDNIHSKTHHS